MPNDHLLPIQTMIRIRDKLVAALESGAGTISTSVDGFSLSVVGPTKLRSEIMKWNSYIRRRTRRTVYRQQAFTEPQNRGGLGGGQ